MSMIDPKLLRYVPKKYHQYVTTLYQQCKSTYALHMTIDDEEYTAICDGVAEIRWAANVMYKERRMFGM